MLKPSVRSLHCWRKRREQRPPQDDDGERHLGADVRAHPRRQPGAGTGIGSKTRGRWLVTLLLLLTAAEAGGADESPRLLQVPVAAAPRRRHVGGGDARDVLRMDAPARLIVAPVA